MITGTDWFDRFFNGEIFPEGEKYHKIGPWVSGGIDSALCLFILAMYISTLKLYNFTIQPIHGYNTGDRVLKPSYQNANEIIDYIRNLYPDVVIKDSFTFAYKLEKGDMKIKYHIPNALYAREVGLIDQYVGAYTLNPPKDQMIAHDIYDDRDKRRDDLKYSNTFLTRPFAALDKKWIRDQYIKYNLEDMLPLTASCISNNQTQGPCKTCWWCKEKYWAFERY